MLQYEHSVLQKKKKQFGVIIQRKVQWKYKMLNVIKFHEIIDYTDTRTGARRKSNFNSA